MAIKKYKPTTPGRRNMSALTFDEITTIYTGTLPACTAEKQGWP